MVRLLIALAFIVTAPLCAQAPVINATPASLNLGTTVVGTTGTPASFTIDGSNLTADIAITPPTGVEIRTGAGAFQSTALALTQTGGTVATTNIDVRTSAAASTGQTFSDITCVAGAASQNITLTGTVIAQPVITVAGGPLAYGSVWNGNPGPERRFTVAGVDLLGDITVSAPTDIELAVVTGGPYTSSVVLAQSGGVVATTTIFARLKASAPGGMMNVNITVGSTSAVDQAVNVTAAVRLSSWAGGSDSGTTCSTSPGQDIGMLLAALAMLALALRTRRREVR